MGSYRLSKQTAQLKKKARNLLFAKDRAVDPMLNTDPLQQIAPLHQLARTFLSQELLQKRERFDVLLALVLAHDVQVSAQFSRPERPFLSADQLIDLVELAIVVGSRVLVRPVYLKGCGLILQTGTGVAGGCWPDTLRHLENVVVALASLSELLDAFV